MLPPVVQILLKFLDAAVVLLMAGAAIHVLRNARTAPLKDSVTALVIYALIAVAALTGCSGVPTHPKQVLDAPTGACVDPRKDYGSVAEAPAEPSPDAESVRLCVSMLEVFCTRAEECGYQTASKCLEDRYLCAGMRGITSDEAFRCNLAVVDMPCDGALPAACMNVADPSSEIPSGPPPSAPDPDSLRSL